MFSGKQNKVLRHSPRLDKNVYYNPEVLRRSPRLIKNGYSKPDEQNAEVLRRSPRLIKNGHYNTDDRNTEVLCRSPRVNKSGHYKPNDHIPEVSRRSPRLTKNGYYHPDDHNIRMISYKETAVRIFKKRKRKRKTDRACTNFTMDFQELETDEVMLENETPNQKSYIPSSDSSFVRKFLPLVILLLLGSGIGFACACVSWYLDQQATQLRQCSHIQDLIIHKIKTLNQSIRDQSLLQQDFEKKLYKALSLYRPDGIGMADHALQSLGASVIASSETHRTKYCKMLGLSFWCQNNGPETVIQPHVFPGNCWGFKGSEGYLVISLPRPIQITHVTLEHLSRVLSPTKNIHSAPKDFAVYGKVSMNNVGKHLGTFIYDQDGEPIQTFQIPDSPTDKYKLVELRILSNWGHPEYTCVYRFRIHSE